MNVKFNVVRDPDPADRVNGGEAGAKAVKIPEGPLDGAMLGKLLEGLDPQAASDETDPNRKSPAGEPDPNRPADGGGDPENPEGQPGTEDGRAPEGGEEQDEVIQGHVKELSELLASGELSIGEVKRIKKLLAAKGSDAEVIERQANELAELRQKLEGASSTTATATAADPANPFAALVKDQATLERAKGEMYDVLEWCEDNTEGGTRKGVEYTADEVKQLRREARRGLDIHLPARERQLQTETATGRQRQQIAQQMKSNHPAFYDRESELGRAAAQFRQLPEVRGRADADVIAAIMALGTKELTRLETERLAKGKGNGNGGGNGNGRPATTVGRITLPPRPGAAAARNGADGVKKALINFGKRPDRNAFTDVLDKMGPPKR